ncbi:MAG: hypothetical protein ACRCYU_11710 [Nocardioides sp.]
MRPERRSLESRIEAGIIAGIASAIPTAVLLAIGGALSSYGASVPFYSIISIVDPGPLTVAIAAVEAGNSPEFFQLQLSGGIGLCFIMGAVSGVIFGFGTRRVQLAGPARYLVGALHGIAMMCVFYLLCFRAVTELLDISDADIMSLARIVGWPILVLAHAVHGVCVAWVMGTRVVAPKQVFGPPITAEGNLRERS